MKKQGKLNLAKHMIGDKMPIVAFLGLSVTTLSGCDDDKYYTAYTRLSTCAADNGSDICNVRFTAAKAEGERTAMKYQTERDCQQDYGDLCYQHDGIWSPKIVGFIMKERLDFVLPFYTSKNSVSSHFGYFFTAKGDILGRYKDADRKKLILSQELKRQLSNGTSDASQLVGSGHEYQGSHSSVVSTVANTYLASRAIDGTTQYLTEREKRKAAQESGGYTVTSGTARTASSSYKSEPRLSYSQVKQYQYKPKVTTVSRGGFGRTGSLFGGFGG